MPLPTLAEELRQHQPFRSTSHEAAVSLLRTSDQLRRRLNAVVEEHGVTLQQFNVLRILRGAGETGMPTLDIAARMVEQAPGITRLVDRLESKRLVDRSRPDNDRRVVICRITSRGLSVLAGLDDPIEEAGRSALNALDERQQKQLIRLLELARANSF